MLLKDHKISNMASATPLLREICGGARSEGGCSGPQCRQGVAETSFALSESTGRVSKISVVVSGLIPLCTCYSDDVEERKTNEVEDIYIH